MPMPVCIILLILGLVLIYYTTRKRTGYFLAGLSIILFLGFSTPILSGPLMGSLESRYLPVADGQNLEDVDTILVLGSGHRSDDRFSSGLQSLSPTAVQRLAEGIRLYRLVPGRQLITSGYSRYDDTTNAERMAEVAVELGIPPQDIRMQSTPKDTNEEAAAMHDYIGTEPFLLVTSASHMPRAMTLFESRGMRPIAAPADVMIKGRQFRGFEDFMPGGENLHNSERAIHEYAGILWASLRW